MEHDAQQDALFGDAFQSAFKNLVRQEAGFLAKLHGWTLEGLAPTMSLAITAPNLGQSGCPSAWTELAPATGVAIPVSLQSLGCGLDGQPRSQFAFGCGEGVSRLHKMEKSHNTL